MNGGRNVGHTAEMCRPPFDADMARNSRIDDRELETELASAGGGIVVLLVLTVIVGVVKLAGWL